MSALLSATDDRRHADLTARAARAHASGHRAVGGGDHEDAPSICAAPVIMFLM
jgi:hypothetical protein